MGDEKKQPFPSTESWDDFLDFSRMRMPSEQIIAKRFLENSLRFSGNYVWMWFVITLAYGLVLSWKMIAAIVVIAFGWFAAEVFYHHSNATKHNTGGREIRDKKDLIPPISKCWLALFAVLILYEFSVLFKVILAILSALVVAAMHAILRPVPNEYYFLQHSKQQTKLQPSMVHSDGFVDQGEDELTFSHDADNSNLRNRNPTKNHAS